MKKMKWGIIGCGGIADLRTIPGMMLAENAECYAVMDINPQIAEAIKEKYNAKAAYTDLDEFLKEDIEAVYIATPVFCHKEQAFKVADAGKHILMEKPMGITVSEAQEISDYCESKGVKLSVGFMMRFHAAHQQIKQMLKDGRIGEVATAYAKFNCWEPNTPNNWRLTKKLSGGGTMMDMGIHCIDLLQYLTDLKTKEVIGLCGNQINKYPDVEDAASAVLRMSNGALFTIESNFNVPDTIGGCKFEIYGTKGVISAVGTIGQTETGDVTITVENDDLSADTTVVAYNAGNMYAKEIEGFTRLIMGEVAETVSADEAIFDQKIVEAIYKSSELGEKMVL